MKPDVLVLAPTLPRQMEQLEKAYTLHRYDLSNDRPAMIAEIRDRCEAIVTIGHVDLDAELIAQLPKLKVVACSSAGFETIDVGALSRRGIKFTNSSLALRDDVADTALMLMLAARRNLINGDAYVRSRDWARKGMLPLTSRTAGKRVGIVGLGSIGTAIAERCAVLGMDIGYFSRKPKNAGAYRYFEDLVKLAEWSNVLIAIVPGGEGTRGLISKEVISAIGPAGTFVNVARGSVVDEPALIAALQSGALGSAGLDVYMNEPDPDPAFASLKNVALYPHHASGTVETRDAMSQLVVDNLAAYFKGLPLLTPVN